MVIKCISGGQTGADLGGLVGARRAGLVTGGTAPQGWRTEKGPKPELATFGLNEHPSAGYTARTLCNVLDSDITIIFSCENTSAGTVFTKKAAEKHSKPYLCVDPFSMDAAKRVADFINRHTPSVMNIAGNRESKCPGIAAKVASIIEQVFAQSLK